LRGLAFRTLPFLDIRLGVDLQVHALTLDSLRRVLGNFGQVRPIPLPLARAANRSHETQWMHGTSP